MSRGTRFAKKMGIYTIGNFGSKILVFLMMPYYTYCISTADYGYYDLLYTTISLLSPLITMETTEAIISGCIDEHKDNLQIIKSATYIMIVNSIFFSIAFVILNQFINIRFGYYFLGSLCLTSIMGIVQQYARGLSYSTIYAVSGIAYTLIFLSLNIITLSVLKLGVIGLFVSNMIASIIVIFAVSIKVKEIRDALRIKLDFKCFKWIIKYSLPLIPNAMCWWLINASDRFVIKGFIGDSANGIYAVSCKYAAIIGTISTLVYYSWQEISLEEFNSSDRSQFYSNSFNTYMKIMLCVALIAISIIKPFIIIFVEPSYSDAWKYTSMLFIGTVFTGLSSFLNTVYLATGKTKEILIGTLIAGAVNLTVDVILIKFIGIYAASFSTLVSAIVLLIRRVKDNKKFYDLRVDWVILIALFSICMILSFIICIVNSLIWQVVLILSAVVISVVINYKSVVKGLVFVKRFFSPKK